MFTVSTNSKYKSQEYTTYVIWNINCEICSKYTKITIIIKIRGETILLWVGNTREENAWHENGAAHCIWLKVIAYGSQFMHEKMDSFPIVDSVQQIDKKPRKPFTIVRYPLRRNHFLGGTPVKLMSTYYLFNESQVKLLISIRKRIKCFI